MNVKNVEAEIRFRYNEAAEMGHVEKDGEGDESTYYTDNAESVGGIGKLLKKGATGAGLIG